VTSPLCKNRKLLQKFEFNLHFLSLVYIFLREWAGKGKNEGNKGEKVKFYECRKSELQLTEKFLINTIYVIEK